ncbi:50S ribosomal protein L32 [Patescibacteria group bacterium]|nr:50S ribosomal protein L32 [Patescibacteria group bacterium]
MALPTKKSTSSKKKKRASHFSLVAKKLAKCTNCLRMTMPHRVCPFCGYYKGKEVFKVLTKEEKKKAREKKAKAKSEKRK